MQDNPLEKTLRNIERGLDRLATSVQTANVQKMTDDPLISEKPVAAILGVSVSWVQHARLSGAGPEFIKIGRAVRYQLSKVQEFKEQRRRNSTSDTGE